MVIAIARSKPGPAATRTLIAAVDRACDATARRLGFSLVLVALTASGPIDAVAEDDSYVTHGHAGQVEGIASLRAALAG